MEQQPAENNFQVIGTSSLSEERTIVLKHDNTFAIFNKYGDILPFEGSAQGIFHNGTRYLSDLRLLIEGHRPLFLSSNLRDRSEVFVVDLTNPDILHHHQVKLEKGLLHIMRKKVIWDPYFYEQIIFSNFGQEDIDCQVELFVNADFADIFEVRGTERQARGQLQPVRTHDDTLELSYLGLDHLERTTRIRLHPQPRQLGNNHLHYAIRLAPGQKMTLSATLSFLTQGTQEPPALDFKKAIRKHKRRFDFIDQESCDITTSNEQFNNWINRSRTDLITMISNTPHGPYPYAGIPWYDTPFGRDGIITALECLWITPLIAKGVLHYLAATQATREDGFRDAEPGKILHETRAGEMALLNEVPFRQYYGTIDATPLFVVLAGAYYQRTDDLDTIRTLWPAIEKALQWIDTYGDTNNDLFVEYSRKEKSGLFNQGWKDSHDSISYADGEMAELPIALCEVQGYVYDAWEKAAFMADNLGHAPQAQLLRQKAARLRERFSQVFWSEEKGMFHLALGNGEPCEVLSSNAGHCLFAGIATQHQAEKLAHNLLSDKMFTGWGIRTLSSAEVRYNPMSYHNGSVWPHDSAMVAYGLSRYGLKDEVKKIATGLFDASLFMDGQRLPELFCGFARRKQEAPTSYPVACSPQAWSVAAVYIIIQSLLGMEINEHKNIIRFIRPSLPPYLDSMRITNLPFKNLRLTLEFVRTGDSVSISSGNKNVRLEIIY